MANDYNENQNEDEMPTGQKGGQTSDERINSQDLNDPEDSESGM